MTDIVDVLRMNDESEEWTNIRTAFLRQAADEIEALRKDNDQLDRLMSDIAMAWVRIPHPPRGQVPSALDLAISRAADFTTGLHRIEKEQENGGHLGEAEVDVSDGSPE
jgi:hypothetical protein